MVENARPKEPIIETVSWQRDQIVAAEVASLTFEGQGVARVDGMVVFVRGAVPGDLADVRLTKVKRSFAEGEAVAIRRPSSWRMAPLCAHFGVCGGCSSQDLQYAKQVEFKTQQVAESLSHIGGLAAEMLPALHMSSPWRYRNKMEFAFGNRPGGGLFLGLMRRGSYHEVTPIDDCLLTSPRVMRAVRSVEAFLGDQGLQAFDVKERTGVLRHLVVREGRRTEELLLNVVTTSAACAAARTRHGARRR